jgi:hypothetical protein
VADEKPAQHDAGAERDARPAKPCCARMRRTWCALPDGHAGPHLSPALVKRFAPHLAIAKEATKP